mgnify:CR=1 FL=1
MLPPAEMPQPTRLSPPYGASAAGSRNTPDPIMLPTTSATAVQNPISRAGAATADAYRWFDADGPLAAGAPQGADLSIAAWPGRGLALANDLEAPVTRRHQEIGIVERARPKRLQEPHQVLDVLIEALVVLKFLEAAIDLLLAAGHGLLHLRIEGGELGLRGR